MKSKNKGTKMSLTDSRPQLAAKAQALEGLGYNTSQITRHLGISYSLVAKLIREDLPAEWQDYKRAVQRYFFDQDTGLAELTGVKLREKLEMGEGKISELAFLYRTLRDLQEGRADNKPTVQLNQNFDVKTLTDEQLSSLLEKATKD